MYLDLFSIAVNKDATMLSFLCLIRDDGPHHWNLRFTHSDWELEWVDPRMDLLYSPHLFIYFCSMEARIVCDGA